MSDQVSEPEIHTNDGEGSQASERITLSNIPEGKKSAIFEHCKAKGLQNACIWLVRRYGHRIFARDTLISDSEDFILRLKGIGSWFVRNSFYSTVAIRHVEIVFRSSSWTRHGLEVIARPVNSDEAVSMLNELQNRIKINDQFSCGVDIRGKRHSEQILCDNTEINFNDDLYCTANFSAELKRRADEQLWMPNLLNFYLYNGIDGKGLQFLRKGSFVFRYENLAVDRFADAEKPYGEEINALELVQGWRVRRLLLAVLGCIVLDGCVVALAVFASGSVEVGFTAGSYAASLEALLIATLAMLSFALA